MLIGVGGLTSLVLYIVRKIRKPPISNIKQNIDKPFPTVSKISGAALINKKSTYQIILIPILMGLLLSGILGFFLLKDLITKGTTTIYDGVILWLYLL